MAKTKKAAKIKKQKRNDFKKMEKNLLPQGVWGALSDITAVRMKAEKEIKQKIQACNRIEEEFGIGSVEWGLAFSKTALECRVIWNATEEVVRMLNVIISESDELFDVELFAESESAVGVKREIDLLCEHGEKKAKKIMMKLGRPEEASDLFHEALITLAESGYDRKVGDFQKLKYLNVIMESLAKDKFTSKNRDFLFNTETTIKQRLEPGPIKDYSPEMVERVESEFKQRAKEKAENANSFPKIHSAEELRKWKTEYDERLTKLLWSLGVLRDEDGDQKKKSAA